MDLKKFMNDKNLELAKHPQTGETCIKTREKLTKKEIEFLKENKPAFIQLLQEKEIIIKESNEKKRIEIEQENKEIEKVTKYHALIIPYYPSYDNYAELAIVRDLTESEKKYYKNADKYLAIYKTGFNYLTISSFEYRQKLIEGKQENASINDVYKVYFLTEEEFNKTIELQTAVEKAAEQKKEEAKKAAEQAEIEKKARLQKLAKETGKKQIYDRIIQPGYNGVEYETTFWIDANGNITNSSIKYQEDN